MTIRTFEPGDDVAQVDVYNEAASGLPRFKPATLIEVRRRCNTTDFDPATRFYAVAEGQVVGYATFALSGRVGFPWCRPGFERFREPLLAAVLQAMRTRGLTVAWTAYRADWEPLRDFFIQQGFSKTQQIHNFLLDLVEMPTLAGRGPAPTSPLRREDLPGLLSICPGFLRSRDVAELEQHLFHNPYFPPESVQVRRDASGQVLAASIEVDNPTYADPHVIDSSMPCFRLGAWGTEGLTHKRIRGGFSVLVPPTGEGQKLALDLLLLAARRLDEADIHALAAQVTDTQGHLLRFYRSYFRQQGSFPIFERPL